MMHAYRRFARACLPVATVACLVSVHACDTTFAVYGDADAYYSVFGVLDASADTQWVRVETLRETLVPQAGPLDARITLTDLASGGEVEWRDSLFSFVGGATAHNAWSDAPILPGGTYRLEVRRDDGIVSAATATLPASFPEPSLTAPPFSLVNLPVSGNVCAPTFEMIVQIERLAALQVTYRIPTIRGVVREHRVSYVNQTVVPSPGVHLVTVNWAHDLREVAALDREIGTEQLLQLRAMEIMVAAAGPEWPDNRLSDETVALPGAVTHVERGVGFLGGVVSRRLHIELGDYREVSCLR